MKSNFKNIAVTICFIIITCGFMLTNIIMQDAEFSYSERRRLAAVPTYSFKKLISGDLFEEYDKYFLDQFAFRDSFRSIKALTSRYLFKQKDNNGLYMVDGSIYKIEYPLNEKAILNAAQKLNEVYSKYLANKNVSYAIIPDKNYFTAAQNGYLTMDYERLLEIMKQNVSSMNYIDLFSTLDIKDFYKTDIHWSQDKTIDIADKLLKEMGNDIQASDFQYEEKRLTPFYGSYYGQAALKQEPDTMVYLTNNIIENAVVFDTIDKEYSKVNMIDNFKNIDSYDLFLSGPKPVISVINPSCDTHKELIIFRDSFGSSIAPLLIGGYSKITLVDLRYIATDILGDYVDFSEAEDILFLYNTQILNNSYMLK
ncbi:DHHW family protein [Clostridium swellfunianum]|uniref:DHHW family protein n=1 Tax=Clostridium swellfunianum TaxID=1367462 RepID=UPI00202F7CA3|nr:DHHW family protein [Clostridium swellfunianum]MCM0651010.1 DHHW family protein [Clostridium swellfunianum]